MEEILKNFSFSFVLRSIFAGAFLPISYYSAQHGLVQLAESADQIDVVKTLSASLFARVVAYGFHRSVIYPLIEWPLNSERSQGCRTGGFTLISQKTIALLFARWKRSDIISSEDIGKHLNVWADYTHLHYVSAECIIFGAIGYAAISGTDDLRFSWPLFLLTLLFFVAALVSDWRLHSVLRTTAHFS